MTHLMALPRTLAALLLLGGTAIAADASGGLATACSSCHGLAGRSAGAIPPLAGLSPPEIAQLLRQFRSGERQGTIMARIAKGYTDQQIDDLAASFGSR